VQHDYRKNSSIVSLETEKRAWGDYVKRTEEWRPEPASAVSKPIRVQWLNCAMDMNLRVA
jgi:hypothetical protein